MKDRSFSVASYENVIEEQTERHTHPDPTIRFDIVVQRFDDGIEASGGGENHASIWPLQDEVAARDQDLPRSRSNPRETEKNTSNETDAAAQNCNPN